ncbi:MAG: hypothetical protein IJ115_00905 [Erysipelotrichaceae bacterium]|nr:hypothetical protein [Erysipelotrichaceae bacterium]
MDSEITTLSEDEIEKFNKKMKEMKNYLDKLAEKSNYDLPVMIMIQNSLSDILDDYIPIG